MKSGGAVLECAAERWEGPIRVRVNDLVANEVALAIVYNGRPYVVMMVTPTDLEDFVLGFSMSEGIVASPAELRRIRVRPVPDGIEANVEIDEARFRALDRKQRTLTGRIGCGLCGAQTIAQAMRHPSPVRESTTVQDRLLHLGMKQLEAMQPFNASTGALHAAGWMDDLGAVADVREDVGRHNALDKLIGARLRTRQVPLGGTVLITSRASHEIVQKAAAVGVEVLCAISAPTALAIRVAEETRVTLIGFVRERGFTVYTHLARVRAWQECVGAERP